MLLYARTSQTAGSIDALDVARTLGRQVLNRSEDPRAVAALEVLDGVELRREGRRVHITASIRAETLARLLADQGP